MQELIGLTIDRAVHVNQCVLIVFTNGILLLVESKTKIDTEMESPVDSKFYKDINPCVGKSIKTIYQFKKSLILELSGECVFTINSSKKLHSDIHKPC